MNPGVLFILSIGVFGGMLGGWFFRKIKIPQVVGYIVIGLLIGRTGFNFVTASDLEHLRLFNFFALGIIGFLVGGELKISTLRKYAKQFSIILLVEGILSFLLVCIACTFVLYSVYPHFNIALATGLVLGAIASATDPASTIDVLWEYRAKGILTTTVIAIVALDDGLAMTLYGMSKGLSSLLTGGSGELKHQILETCFELGGAVLLGIVTAILLAYLLRLMNTAERGVSLSIGVIMIVISAAMYFNMDIIVSVMTLGFVLTNISPFRSEKLFSLMRNLSIPIYVLFFVFVGASLNLGSMPLWLWEVVVVYVIARTIGKVLGAYIGGKLSHAEEKVQKNLGTALLSQGGVAIGLSMVASHAFSDINITNSLSLGDAIVTIVTTTTLIVQLLGPAMVKFSIKKVGEAGKNVTEEDILKEELVVNIISENNETVKDGLSLLKAIKLFKELPQHIFPVVNKSKELIGVLTLESIKEVLTDTAEWNWLLVADVMSPVTQTISKNLSIYDAKIEMSQLGLNEILIVDDKTKEFVGLLEQRNIRHYIHKVMLENSIS